MVVVVDRHADVVQHARGPQKLALAALAAVQAEACQLVEHAQRERRHVARVGGIGLVVGGQVEHARAPHVLEQRRLAPLQQALEEDPLAHARLGRLEARKAARAQHAGDDDRPRQDEVGAGGLDPRDARPLGGRQRGEALDQLRQDLGLDHHPPHAVGRQPRRALGGGGEVAHRAADPHQAPRARVVAPAEPAGLGEMLVHVLFQAPQLPALGRPGAGQEALAHAHRAQRPAARLALGALAHGDQLQRAAAEVQRHPLPQGRRVDGRQVAVAGLGAGIQQAHRKARPRARGGEELRAVGGVADGARGDRVDRRSLQPGGGAEVREDVHRRQRALDRRGAQPAARGQALADAHRLIDLVCAPPPARAGAEHDKPEGVRSEVDHGETLAGLHARSLVRLRCAAPGVHAPGRAHAVRRASPAASPRCAGARRRA